MSPNTTTPAFTDWSDAPVAHAHRLAMAAVLKRIAWVPGGLIAALILFVLLARIFGFDPGPTRPGLWLKGELVTEPVTDWSFAENIRGTAIQTRQSFFPWLAHSVTTARLHHNGRLYFVSGYPAGIKLPEGRHWNGNVLADPRVRIRIGQKLYDVKLVYISDPVEYDEILRAEGAGGASSGSRLWAPGFRRHLWRVDPRD